ncbi:protein of unknown function [Hyphomicrobium sp. 1Nfss2.1]
MHGMQEVSGSIPLGSTNSPHLKSQHASHRGPRGSAIATFSAIGAVQSSAHSAATQPDRPRTRDYLNSQPKRCSLTQR